MAITTAFIVLSLIVLQATAQLPGYCGAPPPVASQQTEGLTLQQAQVITRHGDRTTLTLLPNDDTQWECNLNFLEYPGLGFQQQVTSLDRIYRKVYLPGREYLPGNCLLGQLTDIGLQQHLSLGADFRNMYVNNYTLVSNISSGQVYVRSTDIPRTLQSAQAEMQAMFPPVGTIVDAIEINTMDLEMENMFSNYGCYELNQLSDALEKSPEWITYHQGLQPLEQQLEQILNVSAYDLPSWSSLMDAFRCKQCHQTPITPGVTDEMIEQIASAAEWEMWYELNVTQILRLTIGTFVYELTNQIIAVTEGNTSYKYILYSGHDTTVGPLAAALGIWNGIWPPYASHLELEVWSDDQNNFYVQVKYNGAVELINGCDSVMCPVSTFLESIEKFNINFQTWNQECNANKK